MLISQLSTYPWKWGNTLNLWKVNAFFFWEKNPWIKAENLHCLILKNINIVVVYGEKLTKKCLFPPNYSNNCIVPVSHCQWLISQPRIDRVKIKKYRSPSHRTRSLQLKDNEAYYTQDLIFIAKLMTSIWLHLKINSAHKKKHFYE